MNIHPVGAEFYGDGRTDGEANSLFSQFRERS
jgi:hypothetical protein